MAKVKKYKIKITYCEGTEETIEIRSNNINWSMDQFERNRDPLKWEIIEESLIY